MPTRKPSILIVEDDVPLRALLSAILAESAYNVRSAKNGFAALTEIRAEIPDILLSDLYMSGMSGFELLSVVRRRFPAIRVVAMSGAFAGEELPPGIAADAYYAKATSVMELLRTIETMTRPEGTPPIPRTGAVTPIWVDILPGEIYILVTCTECLRAFPLLLVKAERLIHETDCVHCHSLIHYAVVEPALPTTTRVIQQNTGVESPVGGSDPGL
jgi:CheY-like chemotaxis protein